MKLDLPFIQSYRDRHGRVRCYLRRNGTPRVALTGEPGSPEFLAAYKHALENSAAPAALAAGPAKKGSFDALRDTYYASAEYRNLAKSTKREAAYVIDAFVERKNASGIRNRERPVAGFTREAF